MQYKTLQGLITKSLEKGEARVIIPEELFLKFLRTALAARNEFDEAHYLMTYPDIRQAIKKGTLKSAAAHYFSTGYFEGRVPKKFSVDEKYYLAKNPDVAKGIAQHKVKTCQEHFDSNGFREGRFPFAGFTLF